MKNWDKILSDFAHKCGDGGPDMTNPRHLALLRESLIKFGWDENATNEILGNLRNGKEVIVEKREKNSVWQTDGGWAGWKTGQDIPRYGMDSEESANVYIGGEDFEDEDEELTDDEKEELRKNDRKNVENAARRQKNDDLSDEDAGMGTPESQAQEAVVVEGAMKAKDKWDEEFGGPPPKGAKTREDWEAMDWKQKKEWLDVTLKDLRGELEEICSTDKKKTVYLLSCKNMEASFNTLDRLLIKDDEKNPDGIGIENIEEIAWDTPDGQKLVGTTGHKTPADMFIKTTDGKLAGVSLKESGAVFWINKGYAKEIVKLTDKMEKDMTDECNGDEKCIDEAKELVDKIRQSAAIEHHEKRKAEREQKTATAILDKDSPEHKTYAEGVRHVHSLIKQAYALGCDRKENRGSEDCENLQSQLKKITGQTKLEAHTEFLEGVLGHRDAWLNDDEIDVHNLMTTNPKISQSELAEEEKSIKKQEKSIKKQEEENRKYREVAEGGHYVLSQIEKKYPEGKDSKQYKDAKKRLAWQEKENKKRETKTKNAKKALKRAREKLETKKKNNYGQRQTESLAEGDLMSKTDHKSTFRIFQNYNNPDWTEPQREAHHKPYDEQRKLDAVLTKSMYEALDTPEAKKAFKKWFLKSSHILSSLGILGDEESDTYDSFQVLYGDEGEEDGLSGVIQDRKTLLALFNDDGTIENLLKELDELGPKPSKTKDPKGFEAWEKKRKKIEQEIVDKLLEKIEIDYATGTIFITHIDGNRPLVTLRARSRGTNASPTLEMGTTGYFQKVLKNDGEADPKKWPANDRVTYSDQLLDIYDRRDDEVSDTEANLPEGKRKLRETNKKRIKVLERKRDALEEIKKSKKGGLTKAKQKDLDETMAKLVEAEKLQEKLESEEE
jgi:hypothetical protein